MKRFERQEKKLLDKNKISKEDKRDAAEKVCSSYNVAGIMVARELIDKDFIVDEWRNSIEESWRAAEPIIKEYRKLRGKDYWDKFEMLYNLAKQKDELTKNKE